MGRGEESESLIQKMKSKGNLKSFRVEEAIRATPRHIFVPEECSEYAYRDTPLSIGSGQTISQPSVVAKMTEWLDPQEGEKILEIGTGSGWQAAVLSRLVGQGGVVYTVETIESLADKAMENLLLAGVNNVEVIKGDGSTGLFEHSPYDKIICTAASPGIHNEWVQQLKEGGVLVAPIGSKQLQNMVALKMEKGKTRLIKHERGYRFVELKGERGFDSG